MKVFLFPSPFSRKYLRRLVEELELGVVLRLEAADAVQIVADDDGGGVADAAAVEPVAHLVGDVLALPTRHVGF